MERIYMKKCSMCNKNIAIVFATKIENGKSKMQGLCIECAKKMGIPIVDQIMEQTGMTVEDIQSLTEEMNNMFGDMEEEGLDDNHLLMNIFDTALPSMSKLSHREDSSKNKEQASDVKGKPDKKQKIER
jgi:predicted transcriptional regulator